MLSKTGLVDEEKEKLIREFFESEEVPESCFIVPQYDSQEIPNLMQYLAARTDCMENKWFVKNVTNSIVDVMQWIDKGEEISFNEFFRLCYIKDATYLLYNCKRYRYFINRDANIAWTYDRYYAIYELYGYKK